MPLILGDFDLSAPLNPVAVGGNRQALVAHTAATVEVALFVLCGQEIPVNSQVPVLVHHKQYTINNSKEYIIWA